MPSYLPAREQKLVAWLGNFLTVANAEISSLGITQADLTVITTDTGTLTDDLTTLTSAKAALQGAIRAKDASIKQVDKDVRALVKRIQSNPHVPASLKAQLGMTVPAPAPTKMPPVTPASLLATPLAIGVNALKWHKSGNKASTQYVVLAKTMTAGVSVYDDSGWNIVGQTTRSRFDHTGVTPGVPMAYKVLAARADQASLPSLPATVYRG